MFDARAEVGAFVEHRVPRPERFLDRGPVNIMAHIFFVFGLHPDYAVRTALPDWSLSLEMQFYALFPMMMWLTLRVGWLSLFLLAAIGITAAICAVASGVFFPLPSFLPLKLHLFLGGMAIAAAAGAHRGRSTVLCLFALLLMFVPLPSFDPVGSGARAGLAATLIFLVYGGSAPHLVRQVAGWVSKWLRGRTFTRLGELSYSAYLIHLLVLTPVAAFIFGRWGMQINEWARVALLLEVAGPVTYVLAATAHARIEVPARRTATRICAKLDARSCTG
jgi:peptidoglycan/LPS O-acetylase OafA/YrhL